MSQDTEWDNQQNLLCTHANAKADAVEDAKLKINVPFIKLSLAKEWGPYVKFQWNSTLKDSCINSNLDMLFDLIDSCIYYAYSIKLCF